MKDLSPFFCFEDELEEDDAMDILDFALPLDQTVFYQKNVVSNNNKKRVTYWKR